MNTQGTQLVLQIFWSAACISSTLWPSRLPAHVLAVAVWVVQEGKQNMQGFLRSRHGTGPLILPTSHSIGQISKYSMDTRRRGRIEFNYVSTHWPPTKRQHVISLCHWRLLEKYFSVRKWKHHHCCQHHYHHDLKYMSCCYRPSMLLKALL